MSETESDYSLNKRRLSHKRSVSLQYNDLLSDGDYDKMSSDPDTSLKKQLDKMKNNFEERIEKLEKEVFKLAELVKTKQSNFSAINSKPTIFVENDLNLKPSTNSYFKEPKLNLSSSHVQFLIRIELEEHCNDISNEIKTQIKQHLQMTNDEINSIKIVKTQKIKKTGVIFSVEKPSSSDALKERIKQPSNTIFSLYSSENSNSFTNAKKLFVKKTRLFVLQLAFH